MVLEIYTDASIRTFDNGRVFGCSGALCATNGDSVYTITPDTTNNKSELIAMYNGVILADKIRKEHPEYNEIYLYSDSQFGVFGLTRWIYGWLKTRDNNGVMYGSNGQPVKNQELFAMILSYLASNRLKIHFRHIAGHVRYTSTKMLNKANDTFYTSNGYYLRPEDIYKVSYYNDIVDRTSRAKLDAINPNEFPIMDDSNCASMCRYQIPQRFGKFIK